MNYGNNFPFVKVINNFNINSDYSFINAVLQSFAHLQCVHYWIKIIKNTHVMERIDSCLTKEFCQLYISFLSGPQNIDSTNFILLFQNKFQSIYGNKELKKDPYHSYFYFLELLHLENNCPQNKNYDINLYKNISIQYMINDNYMLRAYSDYFQQTQNSIISDYFFNTEKYLFKCGGQCPQRFYYGFKKIIVFDVDNTKMYRNQLYPLRNGVNLSLDECFQFYQSGKKQTCCICGNLNSFDYKKIFTSSKVIILAFKRNMHSYKGDIDFGFNFSVSNYVIQNTISSMNYTLKSIICAYVVNNMTKYFVDVLINGNWFRFLDNKLRQISVLNDLKKYEPQMLIYELDNDNSSFMNPFYNQANMMNNNNFFVPTRERQIMDQMRQLQMMNLFRQMQQNYMYNQFMMRINDNINNLNNNNNNQNICLKFLIIPENWDNSPENSNTILPQVTLDDTVEKAISNFFIKLQKPNTAIKKFLFNNIELSPKSQNKLRDIGINQNSIIHAIKADNFDSLNN